MARGLKLAVAAAAVAAAAGQALSEDDLCHATCNEDETHCTFKFMLDIFAGETGYYRVEGCDGVSPTLAMIEGVTYTFDQTDPTNWFHPLGFAYGPDGVYGENDELEKDVADPIGDDSCVNTTSCQHAQYKLNGENLCDEPGNCDPKDFGLDQYEGVWFSGGRDDWLGAGNFTVDVTITDPATTEFFYFCHIHDRMSGRVKILDPVTKLMKEPEARVELPYVNRPEISEFDQNCGTFNVSQYQNGKGCPGMTFLCTEDLDDFGKCMVAIDCAMHVEMRVSGDSDPTVTFMHQMIAHHRNAVNMAKILLKLHPPSLNCGTSYDGRRRLQSGELQPGEDEEEHEFCNDKGTDGNTPAVTLLWDIINTQNQQITLMQSWLEDNEQPSHDYCEANDFPVAVVAVAVGAILLIGIVIVSAVIYVRKHTANTSVNYDPESK